MRSRGAKLSRLLFTFVFVTAACSRTPDKHAAEVAEPRPLRSASAQAAPWDARGVHYWIAGCNVGEDLWKYRHHSTTVWCDELGRPLADTEGRLDWPVYVGSGEVDTLRVEGEDLDAVEWTLWWATSGDFTEGRSVVAASSTGGEVRFDLEATAWKDETKRLQRLRLTWRGEPLPSSRVLSARGE